MTMLKKMLNSFLVRFVANRDESYLATLPQLGFHGDRYFLEYVDKLTQLTTTFVETGSNLGTTLTYVAEKYSHLRLYSCEPTMQSYATTLSRVNGVLDDPARLTFHNMMSPEFLYKIFADEPNLQEEKILFWLDAHGHGYKWPLHDELRFITETMSTAIIMVDDTEIPNQPQFKFSEYNGQRCDQAYIQSSLLPHRDYTLIYPNYTEHTSPHHPLVGYTIITYGVFEQELPLGDAFQKTLIRL